MLALQALLAIILLTAGSFGPGFFIVRRLRWTPMEKLCGAVGVSLVIAYLFLTAVYLLSPPGQDLPRRVLMGYSICSVLFIVMAQRDAIRLLHNFRVLQVLGGFLFFLAWTFLLVSMIRLYSGANWLGDWLEHFQRTLFFAHHFPGSSPILFGFQLPARPPAMNELAALFLNQVGDRFEIFQVIFVFLNLLIYLPCCLIMPALTGRRAFVLPLVLLFAANPAVMEQVTYTWTKALAAFFVVLSLSFYLAGLRKNDSWRIVYAFVALSMGTLVHYSAGPYLVFLTLHYLYRRVRKQPAAKRLRESATIAVFSGALLASWFAWSFAFYGGHATFASNTSVTANRQFRGRFLEKTASNLVDSILPAAMRFDPLAQGLAPQGTLADLRDRFFGFYQPNVIFGMGIVGGPLVLWLLYRAFFRFGGSSEERQFWLAMIPACVVLGIGSTGEQDPRGVAHLTLFSLQVIGLSLLAGTFPWRRWMCWLIFAGCAVDFSGGVLLHAYVQNLENGKDRTVYAGLNATGGKPNDGATSWYSVGGLAWENWYLKHEYALNAEALTRLNHLPAAHMPIGRDRAEQALQNDQVYWHGWFARNGGSVTFLGDHCAAESHWVVYSQMGLLVILLGALMLLVIRKTRFSPG